MWVVALWPIAFVQAKGLNAASPQKIDLPLQSSDSYATKRSGLSSSTGELICFSKTAGQVCWVGGGWHQSWGK